MLHFHQRDTENPDLKTLHMAFPMEKKLSGCGSALCILSCQCALKELGHFSPLSWTFSSKISKSYNGYNRMFPYYSHV